jgi:curved DNA-binding protein CbpA
MLATTHYTTLGLVPSATPKVIRAAYKALALICHPDKTVHLAAEERVSHTAMFNQVQAAYAVLGNPALKAAYDAKLACHANLTNQHRSTPHYCPSTHTASDVSQRPKRKSSIKLTTPEEKIAMRARARQSLDHLREKRAERAIEDANMDLVDLKDMVQLWEQLAQENTSDPVMRAHCAIRVYEYGQKVVIREQQHEEWLTKVSIAKQGPSKAATKQGQTARDASKQKAIPRPSKEKSSSPTLLRPHHAHPTERAEQRMRAAAAAADAAAARAELRTTEKAERRAARQAHLDQKVAVVRAQKGQQKAKIDAIAQKEAERIAKGRAKAGAAAFGAVGAATVSCPSRIAPVNASAGKISTSKHVQTTGRHSCTICNVTHTSLRDWRKCNAQATLASGDIDGAFLQTV